MNKFLLSLLIIISAFNAFSQKIEKRIALVIGNSTYTKSPVKSPANDANLIAEELTKSGFEVMLFNNLSSREMKIQISEFSNKLKKFKGIGLFYFTGYGMQLNGENYLVPVDARIEKEQDIELEAINLQWLMSEMEYANNIMNFIIVDASRENPYSKDLKTIKAPGLAMITVPIGTFIAFSTTPGKISVERNQSNSLYAIELVKALQVPNLKVEEIFKKVRTQLFKQTKGKQIPWENSSLYDDFYFLKI